MFSKDHKNEAYLDGVVTYYGKPYLFSFYIDSPDTTPPVVTGCPQDITRQLSTGQTSIAVSWTVPTATDDRTPTHQITVTASHQPNQLFSVGTTSVNYIFTDQSGNIATCIFNINIQGMYLFRAIHLFHRCLGKGYFMLLSFTRYLFLEFF